MNTYEWYKIKSEERARRILDLEADIERLQTEIARLQESLADLLAAEVRSEELSKARNFIEAFAAENLPEDERLALMIFHSWYSVAKEQAAQWQAAEVETAE